MPILIQGQVRDNPKIESEEVKANWGKVYDWKNIVAKAGYGIMHQEASQVSWDLVLTKHIPGQLLEKYRRAAMKKTSVRQLEDETWYGAIPGFEGVWANEEALRDCLNVLDEVLLDWLLLKIECEDKDIPVVEGIDLNVL